MGHDEMEMNQNDPTKLINLWLHLMLENLTIA